MVGHVDFKFVLNANIANIPQIQVTLLKNKAPGLGKVTGEFTASVSVKMLSEIVLSCHCTKMHNKVIMHSTTHRPLSLLIKISIYILSATLFCIYSQSWKVFSFLKMKNCSCASFDLSTSSLCLHGPCLEQRQQWTDKSPSLFQMPCMSMAKRMASLCCTTSPKTSSLWI